MRKGRHCVIRADASPHMGGGHVVRCLALAHFLREAGWECAFACGPGTMGTVPQFAAAGYQTMVLDCAVRDEPKAMAIRWPEGCTFLIVDHYERGMEFESACRGWADHIMVIDDLADRRHDCDVLLDQNYGRRTADYAGLVPTGCTLLLGSDYALLRPEFAALRPQALARRKQGGPVKRVFISFGTVDGRGMCATAIEALEQVGFAGRADVVLGSTAPHLQAVRRRADAAPFDVNIHEDCDDPSVLMCEADLALGAGGGMSWERCCLGLPAVLYATADNQLVVTSALARAGAALVCKAKSDVHKDMARIVKPLFFDEQLCKRVGGNAASMCDGLGANRCCAVLKDALGQWEKRGHSGVDTVF